MKKNTSPKSAASKIVSKLTGQPIPKGVLRDLLKRQEAAKKKKN